MRNARPQPSFGQFAAEHMPEIKARQEAVGAVRAASAGETREELRAMLRDELRSRDVTMPPVAFEQAIESLATQREPFGKTRLAARGLRALWDLGHSPSPIHRILADQPSDPPEDQPDPAWMRTPERAAYPIRLLGSDRAAVELDPTAATLLESAMSASGAGPVQTRNIEVWFDSDSDPSGNASLVSVHLGSKRIGELDAETSERYRPALKAARERDEDPQTDAHLTRIPGATTYVLDVPLPDAPEASQPTAT